MTVDPGVTTAGREDHLAGRLASSRRWPGELIAGAAIVLVVVAAAVLGPFVGLRDPLAPDYANALQPPSLQFPMGTDSLGRDILSRVIYAARVDLLVGLVTTYVPLVIGLALGAIAGYLGGWAERAVMRATDIVIAFPFIVLVLAIVAIIGPGIEGAVIGLIAVSWAIYTRLTFTEMRGLRDRPYILAAVGLGFSAPRILFRHAMPSLLRVNLAFSPVDLVLNILVLASLSFVGAGVQSPTPEWGAMVASGQVYLLTAWWVSVMPGLAIVFTGVGFVLVGDALVDRVGQRTSG